MPDIEHDIEDFGDSRIGNQRKLNLQLRLIISRFLDDKERDDSHLGRGDGCFALQLEYESLSLFGGDFFHSPPSCEASDADTESSTKGDTFNKVADYILGGFMDQCIMAIFDFEFKFYSLNGNFALALNSWVAEQSYLQEVTETKKAKINKIHTS